MRIGQDVSSQQFSWFEWYVGCGMASPAKIQIEIMFDPNIDTWNLYHFFASLSLSLSKFIRKQASNQYIVMLSVYLLYKS